MLEECALLSALPGAGSATVVATAEEAVKGADFVYADSWMSYGEWTPARHPSLRAHKAQPFRQCKTAVGPLV